MGHQRRKFLLLFLRVGEERAPVIKRTQLEPLEKQQWDFPIPEPRWGVPRPQAQAPGIRPEQLSRAQLTFYGCKIHPQGVFIQTKEVDIGKIVWGAR